MTVTFGPKRLVLLQFLCLTGCPSATDTIDVPEDSSSVPSTTGDTPTTGEDPPEASSTSEEGTTSTGDELSTTTGTSETTGALSSTGVEPTCGDGQIDEGEGCDDGFANNTTAGACLPDCTPARCGDGFVQTVVEDCDLGDAGNSHGYGGCNPLTCKWGPRCGDGEIDAPNEVCDPGDPNGQGDDAVSCDGTCRFLGRIAFLSSKKYDGDLGGLAGADKLCRDLAMKFDAAHATTYRAWLSDAEGSPETRFDHGPQFNAVPYVLRNGVQIAADFADLTTAGPWPGIYLTDDDQVLTEEHVWTNTGVDGQRLSAVDHCSGWTSKKLGESAREGINWLPAMSPDLATWLEFGQWTNADTVGCQNKFRLYCFEN